MYWQDLIRTWNHYMNQPMTSFQRAIRSVGLVGLWWRCKWRQFDYATYVDQSANIVIMCVKKIVWNVEKEEPNLNEELRINNFSSHQLKQITIMANPQKKEEESKRRMWTITHKELAQCKTLNKESQRPQPTNAKHNRRRSETHTDERKINFFLGFILYGFYIEKKYWQKDSNTFTYSTQRDLATNWQIGTTIPF